MINPLLLLLALTNDADLWEEFLFFLDRGTPDACA